MMAGIVIYLVIYEYRQEMTGNMISDDHRLCPIKKRGLNNRIYILLRKQAVLLTCTVLTSCPARLRAPCPAVAHAASFTTSPQARRLQRLMISKLAV